LKIIHFVAGELTHGAARGAYWLHQSQREIGIDSTLVTSGRDNMDDDFVVTLGASNISRVKFALLDQLGNLPALFYRKRKRRIFNTGFSGFDFTKLPEYLEADLIHLHWINGLVAMRTLRKVKKPIVWTMRDMWPFTGGCHYSIDCERYKIGCGECPQLLSKHKIDLSRLVVANKRASLPKQLRVVGISHWLSDCASASRVFGDFTVQTISNNIDTRTFSPVGQQTARQILKLPTDKKIILVGAQWLNDFYKGFGLFNDAMNTLQRTDIHVVTFGHDSRQAINLSGITTNHLGFLDDAISLRLAYSAADLFVAPSLMEAFGKTLVEAQACGTPVVCFDATGPKDIVEHQLTGYKAQPFEANDLARGIEWILDLPSDQYELMRDRSRKRVVKKFDSLVIAKQYQELYKEMLGVIL
jgi:glycosyltransferase involved in cell wall biosynthesis